MAGLLSVGTDYSTNAMSGMVRQSALEQQRTDENKQLKAQKDNQTMSMTASGAGIGFEAGGVYGAAAGAAVGFLFSELY